MINKEELEQFLLSKPTNTELTEKLIETVNKSEWHNLKENPNDLPPAQDYEFEDSIDHWKWYLVKTDYTDYKSCNYTICARILMPRYSNGIEEPIWRENSGIDIGDDHVFGWKEIE